jgi:hypothetical protein
MVGSENFYWVCPFSTNFYWYLIVSLMFVLAPFATFILIPFSTLVECPLDFISLALSFEIKLIAAPESMRMRLLSPCFSSIS